MSAMVIVCALTVGALAIAGWVVNVAESAPNLNSLPVRLPGSPSEIFAGDGTSLGYIWSPSVRTPVAGNVIPPRLKQATIAIEDRRFYQHGALDYQGILRAAIKDAASGGTSLQGASTLTMQLVDNVYLPQTYREQHDLKYKIIQAKLAEQLEGRHSKDWILDSYLNDVPYGTVYSQEAYGVGAASRMFFDKPVQRLTLAQEALLAGLPQAPSQYDPFAFPAAARRRRSEVLQAMVTAHYISQAQADSTARMPLEVKADPTSQVHEQPYVFDYIEQSAARDLCPRHPKNCRALQQGGLKIYSTIDLRKEALAQQAIANHESTLAEQGGPGAAAAGLVSIDPLNGHIEAIANSSTYSQTSFDYATQALRQTGSAFKVFALMTLIHDYHGDPNSTYYVSKPLAAGWLPSAPTWSVHTDEDTYQGTISVTKATVVSDNTVFAQLAADVGADKLDATAHAMGITSPLFGFPAEVLGGLKIGVSPLQMADAYATLANSGVHIPATIINTIAFPDGKVENFGNPPHTRVFTDGEADAGTDVLKGVITSGTGTAANYGCPAAGKTGTAEDFENAWFVGYTPRMSTAVWVGYPQGNIPMADGYGGTLAAPIWHDYMEAASSGYCGNFPLPTTPFVGTAFFGPHSVTGAPIAVPNAIAPSAVPGATGGAGLAPGTTGATGGAAGTGGGTGATTGTGAATGTGGGTGAATGTGGGTGAATGTGGRKKH
ncbi:MAG: transglycosylase domain-containing protein [Solirubrobacteraceae bacterium]